MTAPDPRVLRSAPLTVGQTRLWFADRFDPGDPAYNMPAVRRLSGPLDADALERSFDDLVRRHDIIRTVYADTPDGPVQRVLAHQPFTVDRLDVSGLAKDAREAAVRAAVRARTNQRMDLEHGPVLDAALIRLADDDHVLCLVMHHIAGDGWSISLLFQEIELGYARHTGQSDGASPPDLTEQFTDVALAEQALLAGRDAAAALDYWADRLADCPVLDLPTDRPRPAVRTSDGATVTSVLDAGLTAQLQRFARDHRCTLFMTLLAGYEVLLARHAGQQEVAVGSPVAGRTTVAHESLIGYFVNTVVFRGDLRDNPTFRQHLRSVRSDALGAFTHTDIPFERLLDALDVPRDPSRTALYQAMFALHTEGTLLTNQGTGFPGLSWTAFDTEFQQAKADLLLDIWSEDQTLVCAFTYSTALWDEATVQRLAERFQVLLHAVVDDPDFPVAEIPLTGATELKQLETWAGGPSDTSGASRDQTVLAAFAAVAETQPERTALMQGTEHLAYGLLAARVDGLAARLIEAGAGPDRIVALYLPKSPDLIVAMLAVWRAGAAYLPLDPDAPANRTVAVLAASGAVAVVTDDPPFDTDVTLVSPSQEATGAALLPDLAAIDPDSLAYVIYTSGSTGEPKGVAIPHRAVAARVRWMAGDYGLTPEDQVLQFAATTFDTHVEEVFPTLARGATLVLPTESGVFLPEFLDTPYAADLTVLDLPTALWHELVTLEDVRWPEKLRLLIIGGDQAAPEVLAAWRARFADRVTVANTYGPTETTVIATAARLDGTETARPPIGLPIGDTTVRVLDRFGEQVPIGVPGILHVGGPGLARGYLGAPGATAARFLPDPYGPPGARRYDTGDRAMRRPDGQLVFLGRVDQQVKIRGFRVEPAEVEAALAGHRRIAQAAVLVRGEGTERELTAYAVPRPGAEPTGRELRDHLAGRLPAYLVPATVTVLPRLPLTAHGKLDVRALPQPDRTDRATEYVPCEPGAEQLVADVWAELFGLERVGATDDFFALGGHSLTAMKVIGRIRAASGVAVPLKVLFTESTVRAVAAELTRLVLAELEGMSDDEALAQLAEAGGA